MWVLGLNWVWHDAAACLVDGTGRPVAFVEEERLCRSRHAVDTAPRRSAAYCLRHADIDYRDLDVVAVGWDIPRMFPDWYSHRNHRTILRALLGRDFKTGRQPELVFVPHHEAHAHSTFHASGFMEAAVLVVDGSGERESASIYSARRGMPLDLLAVYPISQSLGALYEGVSLALGLGRFGAGKTMGLASYGRGKPVLGELPFFITDDGVRPVIELGKEASYQEWTGAWRAWFRDRMPSAPPLPRQLVDSEAAVRCAWTCQWLVEHELTRLASEARDKTGIDTLALAGGVALNCAANGRLQAPVYVPPVPHDAGVALGAAWAVQPPDALETPLSPYLGPACPPAEVDAAFEGMPVRQRPFDPREVANLLAGGAVGAVVDSRAEVGPRALGHRSLIALPQPEAMRHHVNRMKGREPWRPLAPVAPALAAAELWRSPGVLSRYMLGATEVTEMGASVLPAAVHVDGTVRCQEIGQTFSYEAATLGSVLAALAGIGLPPVLINTSFNGPGEPIVCTARDAAACFASLRPDFLVIGERMLLPNGPRR